MMIDFTFKGELAHDGLRPMRKRIDVLKAKIRALPQYEPVTRHYFHAGMYCREVYRDAGVCVIGAVHKKEHFYVIASGTVLITDGEEEAIEVTGPYIIKSKPGTQRAVTSLTPTTCMTFHVTNAKTVEEAERELVEDDPQSMYLPGNVAKQEVLS